MRLGEKMSDEQKAKVSASRKGKGLGNTHGFRKGQSFRKGVVLSEETKEKMRRAKLGKPSPRKGIKLSLEERKLMRIRRINYLKRIDPDYDPSLASSLDDDRKRFRRERIKIYGGFHSTGEWENLKIQYNWTCPNCKKTEPEIKLTRDHIVPISKGGTDNIENIQPLCVSCNSRKNTQIIKYKLSV